MVATSAGATGLGSAGAVGRQLAVPAPTPASNAGAADPALSAYLDDVVSESPADTCLSVKVDGRPMYVHDGETPMIPASTLKLLTASAALDELGADHRFTTRAVSASAPVKGLVDGDLVLVGGGDPLLTTGLNRLVRHIGDDLHPTSLEQLADQVAASGVRMISGRVVGDESRYDTNRTVASWPDRYVTQNQSGPLSALTVDDGYDVSLDGDNGEVVRRRSDDAILPSVFDASQVRRERRRSMWCAGKRPVKW